MSLPLGLKAGVATHVKRCYRGTSISSVSGLVTILLRRELKNRQRLSLSALGLRKP